MDTNANTEERIREAAFRALAEHGYADLSLTDIGEELGQNPSLIYHYYDSKDDLLVSMLEGFTDVFVSRQLAEPITDAEERLSRLVDQVRHPTQSRAKRLMATPPADMETAVARVHIELWSQASRDPEYRERATAVRERLRGAIVEILEAGVEGGEFDVDDPEQTAEHVLALLLHELHTRATTNRTGSVERIESLLDETIADLRSDAADAS
ncbi:TetR/AcrR family transcriptional regulator [Halorarum halobium]|uniref:TetR/AcrR family transcriptional regulator n=1 Tax=Halorarum halobium TaxID=3075121 RepID=UPI0028A8CFC8|nr:TetR/AcrR family transcriptional regulator [Halobaculum sp. XH14]